MGLLVTVNKLIVTSSFPWKIIRAITYKIGHVEKSSQVVIYGTICTGHIQHNNHDVIIVEVTMVRQSFQKLKTLELTKMDAFSDIFRNVRYFS